MNFRKQIKAKIGRSNEAAGLEIMLCSDGTHTLNLCVLHKKRTIIEKIKEITSNDYAVIRKEIGSDTPVSIVITGQGIINKKIAIEEGIKENQLIHKILPNANYKDFYLQNVELDSTHAYVSLARRDLIDKIWEELNSLKLEVVGCTFGPFCMSGILPLISVDSRKDDILKIGAYSITVKEGNIDLVQNANEPSEEGVCRIAEEKMEARYITAYSSALVYFTQNGISPPEIPTIENALSNYIEKRFFSMLSKGVLGVFLIILLFNYFLFNHYFQKQNILESKLAGEKSLLGKYDTLKSALAEKQGFLEKMGFLGKPKTSFYADQLAKAVPAEITLNEMNINPLKRNKNLDDW